MAEATATPTAGGPAQDPSQPYLDKLGARAGAAPGSNITQVTDAYQQKLLDRMGARFGLPPGSTMDQVQAAQQAHLDKNDPAASAQYKQNMTNIDAGNTAANKPVQLAPKAPDADFAAGLAAQKAGASPTEIMLTQPGIAGNQSLLDAIAPSLGLPAGSTVEQLKAAAKQRAAGKGPAEQQAIDDIAKGQGLPAGMTRDELMAAWKKKVTGQFTTPAATPAQPVAENAGRAVNDKGLTQQRWLQLVQTKFPTAKIVQAKMIDGPCRATLPDGRTLSWVKVEQDVAEGEVDSDGHSVDHADSGEYDYEGDQARDQMNTIVRAARRLDGLLDDNENMPEWVQMKVTLAADYLDTAADYIESNQEPELEEGDRVGNMDADKFDAAMSRLKQLAGAGPMKTVYDPAKRVYRNVPVAVQPKK
jgi:hypothetical protein